MSDSNSSNETGRIPITSFPRTLTEARSIEEMLLHVLDEAAGEATISKFQALSVSENRYELGAWIADGGMGKLYAAVDTVLGRQVAIKVLKQEFWHDSAALLRFLQEARIHSQFHHRGIPPLHDIGRFKDGKPFLAMKHIRARTLTAVLPDYAKDGRELECLPFFVQVCEAVGYAHSKGVIHRDLTPNNVLVSAKGRVHVIDWGLAKVITPQRGDSADGEPQHDTTQMTVPNLSRTAEGLAIGTPAYMAPEQALGAVDGTVQIYVFGLGGILCFLLTGTPPFEGKLTTVMKSTRKGDLAPAYARLDRCKAPKPLRALAKACLSPDLAVRPKHVAAVVDQLAKTDLDEAPRRSWWGKLTGG